MTGTLTMVSGYAVLLAITLLTPYLSTSGAVTQDRDERHGWPIPAIFLAGAIVLVTAGAKGPPLLSVFLVLPLLGLGMHALLGGIVAVLLFATITWWTPALQFAPISAGVFSVFALAAASLPRWERSFRPVNGATARQPSLMLPLILCGTIGLATGLLTAPFASAEPLYIAWHHWGAYLSPVEAWRGGGLPYRDFPIQYGLGPTSILMAACGTDCWRGMYATAIVANALYFTSLAGCAIILTEKSGRGVRWLALVALFCACFVWTGFPASFAGPAMTPSVAGLRFLTISALLLHILIAEQRKVPRDWIGHAIWLVDLFWSPEAGFFGTLIWWPYLAMRDASRTEGGRDALIALARGALRAAVFLCIALCCLALTVWLLSGKAVTLMGFLAYIQHPPGTLLLNPTGTIWIALASIILAIVLLARQGLSSEARVSYACLLGFLAACTYYISRSHDNNILNLFPLLIPVLLSVLANLDRFAVPARDFTRAFAHTLLAAMIAFVATFNFGPWRDGAARSGPFALGPSRIVAGFTPACNADPALLSPPAVLSPDAVAGLDYLRGRKAGMVVLLDERRVLPRWSVGRAWTGVNNIANFSPLPDPMVLHYIRQGATSYHRPGWILADANYAHWVDMFKTSYAVREQRQFGGYRAYYLVPR